MAECINNNHNKITAMTKQQTLIKVQYNKKFKHFEVLTAVSANGEKVQKFGNDLNIYGDTPEHCINEAFRELRDDNPVLVTGAKFHTSYGK